MPITPDQSRELKDAVGEFANAAAALREAECDELYCEVNGRTPGPHLLDQLEQARSRWRKAHTRVYKLIDDLTEEGH